MPKQNYPFQDSLHNPSLQSRRQHENCLQSCSFEISLPEKIHRPLAHPAGKEQYVKGTAKAAPSPGSGVSGLTQYPPSSCF